MIRGLIRTAVLAVMSLAVLSGPASAGPDKVRVANGTTPDILTVPDVRAFDHFLKQNTGIASEVSYLPGAVRAIQAVIADQADVGIATLNAGLAAVLQGQDIVVFALASGARPYLVLTATGDVKGLKELEGRTVGVIALVDSTYYLPVMQMRAANVDTGKVRWQPVGGGAGRGNALISGGIQAAAFQVGQALELADKGFHIIDPPAKNEDFIFKAFWARRSFLEANPKLATEIVKAHLQATREALDKQAFVKLAAERLKPMTEATIGSAYDILRNMGVWDPNDDLLNKTAGDHTVTEMVRFKVIEREAPFEKWATDRFVKEAVAALGRK
ncbi:ABC transporter substrate-binding protein [Bradyrhizobium sp. NP1]|uniref:ABC transporter substrate-binding protein n=1 Tax=Bradyrhizobium sp. NP1 TaxID=3049772 RepID=UPI0025A4EA0F|nr:ABC transporter substrate-binding protein [Bradyrhizobium sp. NP1]WJR75809.1 ABC transporter substrate-binding protein [Bradyrhizobium sp. NP1]